MNYRDINCGVCGVLIKDAHPNRKFCKPCARQRDMEGTRLSGAQAAYKVMNCAIRHGFIAPVKTRFCVDCNAPAEHYDHRDYNKPLEVEPVCSSCNARRGKALPHKRVA